MSLRVFWKRNLGFFKMAITSNLEYRVNYLVDAVVQPSLTTIIEMLLWMAIFKNASDGMIGGFPLPFYLSYALWGAFFARISSSWMYEFKMIDEIDSGSVNGLLVRPMSFYEYYFSQLMGYKSITTFTSFLIPLTASFYFQWPVIFERIPLAVALVFYYLFLVHGISFFVTSFAFFLNRIHSFTVAKNLALWIVTGELLPLDLMPDPYRQWVISLPFSSGVYLPVGYLTGRFGFDMVLQGFVSVTIGLIVIHILGFLLWRQGLKTYSGTGA